MNNAEKIHGVGTVTRKTGLTAHILRAWERRYDAVSPRRTAGNQRLYSDADILRLVLLRRATETGLNISRAAGLDNEQLREYLSNDRLVPTATESTPSSRATSVTLDEQVLECVDAVFSLDDRRLYELFRHSIVEYGQSAVLNHLFGAFATEIGNRWQAGSLRVYHEHLASAVVRSFLGEMLETQNTADERPVIVCTTPSGQRHEIGAMLCAAVATTEGVRPVYLGPDTPASEIIKITLDSNAKLVALSLYYPTKDRATVEAIREIREAIRDETVIVLGGPAASWYAGEIGSEGVFFADSMTELRDLLVRM